MRGSETGISLTPANQISSTEQEFPPLPKVIRADEGFYPVESSSTKPPAVQYKHKAKGGGKSNRDLRNEEAKKEQENNRHSKKNQKKIDALAKIESKDDVPVITGESAYFVPDDKIRGVLSKKFPTVRWTDKLEEKDFYPMDPFFVGYYHYACSSHSYAPDVSDPAFKLNCFDESQFKSNGGAILRLYEQGRFFCQVDKDVFHFGVVRRRQTQNFNVLAKFGNEKGYSINKTEGDGEFLSPSVITAKHKEQIVAKMVLAVRGKTRDEKLKASLSNKFLYACQHLKVDPSEHKDFFDQVLQHVWEHDDYEFIPYCYTEAMIAKLPDSNSLVSNFPKLAVSSILRGLNEFGELDKKIANKLNEIRMKYDEGEYDVDVVYAKDWIKNLIVSSIPANFEGVGAMGAIGLQVFDVCGVDLCGKKITYEVQGEDVMYALIKLCQPRLAYVKIGPSLPDYEPQVSRTCVHNSINALQTRFITTVSEDDEIKDEKFAHDKFVEQLINQLSWNGIDFNLMTYNEFIQSMNWSQAMKRQAYLLIDEIDGNEESWLDVKTRAFAKWEELKNKESLNTRLIQGFSLGFSLITGRVIKSLYKALKPALSNPYQVLSCGSMMTAEKIGLWHKIACDEACDITCLDGDAYDATTRANPVRFMYQLFEELAQTKLIGIEVLERSLKLSGSLFAHGISYRIPEEVWRLGLAPMASGRADTTLTNSLLRLREGYYYLIKSGNLDARARVIASGDDLNVAHYQPADFQGYGKNLGRVEKIEVEPSNPSVFLRKYMYPVGDKLIPGSQIGRVISKMGWIKADVSAKKRYQVLRGDALGRLACDSHVPVVSELCARYVELTRGKKAITNSKSNFQNWTEYEEQHKYDDETLQFVCKVYDIGMQDLLEVIEIVKNIKFEDDLDHWVFRRFFEVDVGFVAPVRNLVSEPPILQMKNVEGLASVFDFNTFMQYWPTISSFLYVLIIAPTSEEALKTLYPNVVWNFFMALVISTIESNTIHGFDLVDLCCRLFFHFTMAKISAQSLVFGIFIHFLHNLSSLFGAPLFFFMKFSSTAKVGWTTYRNILLLVSLFADSRRENNTFKRCALFWPELNKKYNQYKYKQMNVFVLVWSCFTFVRDVFCSTHVPIDPKEKKDPYFGKLLMYLQKVPLFPVINIHWVIHGSIAMMTGRFMAIGVNEQALQEGITFLRSKSQAIGIKLWDRVFKVNKNSLVSGLMKRPELFSSVHDFLGLCKYRATWFDNLNDWLIRKLLSLKKLIKKTFQKKQKNKSSGQRKPKGSLGRSLLTAGGTALGSLLGPSGAAVGSQVGNFLATMLGAGDYKVQENSLLKQSSVMAGTTGVPTFHSGKRSTRIVHREYLMDITGSTNFSLQSFNLNPGLETTFPWLAQVSNNFQAYKFHGLVFEFWSTSADALNNVNTALGTVIMGTNYNAARANFVNKAEMEQYEFSCSSKPSMSLIHPVECAPGEAPLDELYIRTGALPAGEVIQFYDLGKFQLATVGMQAAANIGELWVSYDVELYKPRIDPAGAYPGEFTRINNGPYVAAANILGSIQTNPIGNLGVTITSTNVGWDTLNFPSSITGGSYFVMVTWQGTAAAIGWSANTFTNLTQQNRFNLSASNSVLTPPAGVSSAQATWITVVSVNGYNANGSQLVFNSASTLPSAPVSCSIYVIAIPYSESFV